MSDALSLDLYAGMVYGWVTPLEARAVRKYRDWVDCGSRLQHSACYETWDGGFAEITEGDSRPCVSAPGNFEDGVEVMGGWVPIR
jgi:hypothetical protein